MVFKTGPLTGLRLTRKPRLTLNLGISYIHPPPIEFQMWIKVPGDEPQVLCMLSKHSSTKTHPASYNNSFWLALRQKGGNVTLYS